MILKCGLILLSSYTFLANTRAENPWTLKDTFALSVLEYEEGCEETAKTEWEFINNPTNNDLRLAWENAQTKYRLKKKLELAVILNETNVEPEDQYTLSVAKQLGDMLLNSTEWDKLVSFAGKTAILRTGTTHTDGTENHTRREIEKFLSGNAKAEDKRSAWSSWHLRLSPLVQTYSSTLQLVPQAAKANGVENVAEYWELLSDYTEGYEKMKGMWEEITYLHEKLVTFVRNRLAQKYKITLSNSTIPAYLLGSLDGDDWTSVAADIVPYGNVSYSIMNNLWRKNLRGRTLYRSASAMGKSVLKEPLESDFWEDSRFNQTCSTQLVNFCRDGATRVLTCHQASIKNYLTAHKVVAKVLMNEMRAQEYTNLLFNTANRYSGLDEAVSELFSILSVGPGQLVALGLIDNSTTSEEKQISSLMITALDVLPRLAYYISADLWRIDVIKNGTFAPKELLESWWQYRKRYEKVTADSSDVPTFLDDEFITSNKPYLPKFVGIVLAFQLYQYVTDSTEVRYNAVQENHAKPEFVSMLQQHGAEDWSAVIQDPLSISDVTTEDLSSFFAPLVEYLENNSEDISPLTASQEADLRHLEELYESIDVTTTPRPTSTSAPVPKPKPKNPETPAKPPNSSLPLPPPVVSTAKPLGANKPVPVNNDDIYEGAVESNSDKSVNMNTSKAVWAVAVVLVATVTICIIAIFGRRRCVKSQTPKNRRYV